MKKTNIISIMITVFIITGALIAQQKQGTIYFKDKTTLSGKILRITSNNVEIDPIGDKPFVMVPKSNITMILYEDNTYQDFSEKSITEEIVVNNTYDDMISENNKDVDEDVFEKQVNKELKKDKIVGIVASAAGGAAFMTAISVLSGDDRIGQSIIIGAIMGLIGYLLS